MRLVAYLRVSTDTQVEEGNGLDVQERMIAAWATRNGHEVVATEVDAGISGVKPVTERPGLASALHLVQTGDADGIVVKDLDRLARSVTTQEALLAEVWRRPESRVFTVSSGEVQRDDPDDPLRTAMREMVGVFAGLERATISKRLRDGRKARAARGGHAVGRSPYGWAAIDGDLIPIPLEQTALKRMCALRAAGATTRVISSTLAAEGHPTKRGGEWSSAIVSRILSRHPSKEAVA
ncbi:recombinase family protein [Rathayibacter sp. VKM Ac-2927]|uniref:recombinase family protein n=1 Tax=Rathayibacter sp. VKM Ac-2927 TaxID=2929478 RepID=UPI001FB34563|nr:recombinase family protein [Rathayibacter sp. VKM Ac-2927]MCJ1686207.1 recombinase family protein [Rathayibacter sp. VKM Ac-2927]